MKLRNRIVKRQEDGNVSRSKTILKSQTPSCLMDEISKQLNKKFAHQAGDFLKNAIGQLLQWVKEYRTESFVLWNNSHASILHDINQVGSFSQLKYLNVGQNRINNVEALNFLNCPLIETLVLSSNELCSVKALRKTNLTHLQSLLINSNFVVSLDDSKGLPAMQTKKLEDLEISGRDSEFRHLCENLLISGSFQTLVLKDKAFRNVPLLFSQQVEICHELSQTFQRTNSPMKALQCLDQSFGLFIKLPQSNKNIRSWEGNSLSKQMSTRKNKIDRQMTQFEAERQIKRLFYVKSKHASTHYQNHPYFAQNQSELPMQKRSLNNKLCEDLDQKETIKQSENEEEKPQSKWSQALSQQRTKLINPMLAIKYRIQQNKHLASWQNRMCSQTFNAQQQSILRPKLAKFRFSSQQSLEEEGSSSKKRLLEEVEIDGKEFVKYPTDYGLGNTVKYIRDKSFLNPLHSKPASKKMEKFKTHNGSLSKEKSGKERCRYMSGTICNDFHKNSNQSLQKFWKAAFQTNFSSSPEQESKQMTHFNRRVETENIHSLNTNSFSREKKSLISPETLKQSNSAQKGKNKIYHIAQQPKTMQSRAHLSTEGFQADRSLDNGFHNQATRFEVTFIFAKRLRSFSQIPIRTIKIDLLPFVIGTFKKCKIRYKQMKQQDFTYIKESISKVCNWALPAVRLQVKDIINIGSVQGLVSLLQSKEKDSELQDWAEIVRYFFLPCFFQNGFSEPHKTQENKIFKYQFEKAKDEVAKLAIAKFDVEFGQKQLLLYDAKRKQQVVNIFGLLNDDTKFLIGDNDRILEDYQRVVDQQNESASFNQKVRKWKSITVAAETVPSDFNQSFQGCTQLQKSPITKICFSTKKKRVVNSKNPNRSHSHINEKDARKLSEGHNHKVKGESKLVHRRMSDQMFNMIFDTFHQQKHSGHKQSTSSQRAKLKKEIAFFQ